MMSTILRSRQQVQMSVLVNNVSFQIDPRSQLLSQIARSRQLLAAASPCKSIIYLGIALNTEDPTSSRPIVKSRSHHVHFTVPLSIRERPPEEVFEYQYCASSSWRPQFLLVIHVVRMAITDLMNATFFVGLVNTARQVAEERRVCEVHRWIVWIVPFRDVNI